MRAAFGSKMTQEMFAALVRKMRATKPGTKIEVHAATCLKVATGEACDCESLNFWTGKGDA